MTWRRRQTERRTQRPGQERTGDSKPLRKEFEKKITQERRLRQEKPDDSEGNAG